MKANRHIIIAWIIGEGIIIARGALQDKRPPWPSELFFSSLVFATLGFLAESENAASIAVLLAYGFDAAAFMRLFDPTLHQLPTPQPKQVVAPDKGAV